MEFSLPKDFPFLLSLVEIPLFFSVGPRPQPPLSRTRFYVREDTAASSVAPVVFLQNFFAMADDEPVDEKKYFQHSCRPKCVRPLYNYRACVKRIQGDETGQKHCTGQYFDYWSCIDQCVAPRIFKSLK